MGKGQSGFRTHFLLLQASASAGARGAFDLLCKSLPPLRNQVLVILLDPEASRLLNAMSVE
ncbi:unnamed protein product [Ciceribacter selenitireducens ATCC BAA-1503]|uniref:Uncharacterized protein n=1 Tax=Ciceribacter selenitireducens ATCC BAA-1503 TaxID=1336235 RepID=A0A376AE92_9HYPH|nr:unnamed protein product [Ciceribacter selenitireducens ATCC BAA-1503]